MLRLEFLILLINIGLTVALNDVAVSRNDVYFQYYSNQYTVISVPENDIAQINLQANCQIFIFIHSYWDFWNEPYYYKMKNHLWSSGKTNIIMIDYGKLAAVLEYRKAAKVARGVGNIVASWILALAQSKGISLGAINLVGANLGAHIAGFAGKRIYASAHTRIGFIYALDPCGGPYYTTNTPAMDRLDIMDARVVIAFRTDTSFLGYYGDLGDIDVYINKGHSQSFCTPGLCGHRFALEAFVYCLANFESFTAIKCDSYVDFHNKYSTCHTHSSKRAILVCGGSLKQMDAGRYYVRYIPKQ